MRIVQQCLSVVDAGHGAAACLEGGPGVGQGLLGDTTHPVGVTPVVMVAAGCLSVRPARETFQKSCVAELADRVDLTEHSSSVCLFQERHQPPRKAD